MLNLEPKNQSTSLHLMKQNTNLHLNLYLLSLCWQILRTFHCLLPCLFSTLDSLAVYAHSFGIYSTSLSCFGFGSTISLDKKIFPVFLPSTILITLYHEPFSRTLTLILFLMVVIHQGSWDLFKFQSLLPQT